MGGKISVPLGLIDRLLQDIHGRKAFGSGVEATARAQYGRRRLESRQVRRKRGRIRVIRAQA